MEAFIQRLWQTWNLIGYVCINDVYYFLFSLLGSEQQVEQPVDFQFAQTELMMNEISSGIFMLCHYFLISFCSFV